MVDGVVGSVARGVLVLDLSPTDNLAESRIGQTLVWKVPGCMKNLSTNMTYTPGVPAAEVFWAFIGHRPRFTVYSSTGGGGQKT